MKNSDKIMAVEQGEGLSEGEVADLFVSLINSGDIWKLPTRWLEAAKELSKKGVINLSTNN